MGFESGEKIDLLDFFPMQKDLPPCYGTQENYLESNTSQPIGNQINALKPNQKQNLQLRGYLAIYEQLLYLIIVCVSLCQLFH